VNSSKAATDIEILCAPLFHTPGNPFHDARALVALEDGALAILGGKILACGPRSEVIRDHPNACVRDLRGGYLLPGFIDTHVHFPQGRILGGLGHSLLDWLDRLALPEEVRLADPPYAATVAEEFLYALASHGTTTALIFGAHFPCAMAEFFDKAGRSGLRVIAGLTLADRMLRPELHTTPDSAWRESRSLIDRFHGKGRLSYAVTPRFALSASGPLLDVCQALLASDPTLRLTTHINESPAEIQEVARLFPDADDYLDVYQRYGLAGRHSVFAHNVHASDGEIARLAACGSSVAHCPASNAALGSGIFPLQRHLEAGVRCALGTDVGGGTGFGIMKESLQAYLMQRLAPRPMTLTPAQMLYLATRAGAEALAMDKDIGDFTPNKSADFVYLVPPSRSPLSSVLAHTEDPERKLAAILTLAGADSVREVRVAGDLVYGGAA
jgi:guanine deaminase